MDFVRLWDLPDEPIPIGIAVSRDATDGAAKIGAGARAIGQIPVCWDADEGIAVRRAQQFRWFVGGWAVSADLPTTAGFAGATKLVRPEDASDQIACGPDLDVIVEKVGPFWDAGFTDIALVQVGGESCGTFLDKAAEPLLEKLHAAAG
ncbi:hypothetical protein [Nocardioides sp. InS609-2]|uniref:hypothetical protein n=1 Tax=Nocardioides sp. InS609-2 TaxID=2760705 RepID=UPI0020BDAEB5|nr:hypothetical protein [Nocardioides sp. InS609-2]